MIGVQDKSGKATALNFSGYAVVFLYLLFVLYPIFWIALLSAKNEVQAFADPPLFIFQPTFENYYNLFVEENFGDYLLNSIIVAISSSVICLLFGVPMAYASARVKTKNTQRILAWVLISRMAPAMTYVIPYFVVFSQLRLIDTHFGLILTYSTLNLPLVIWLMRSFFLKDSTEIYEAASMDGASAFQTFFRIALPMATPGITSTGIIAFVVAWNEFIFALVLTRRHAVTAQIGIGNLQKYEGTEWGQMAAGAIILILPAILISVFISKFFVQGQTSGSTKG
ncbi:MAG: carbohydrate ABC transporter permease [Albidovulum sp.]|nr:carbohydrate ABC transporter permease [Albidovulum sp.]